VLGDLDGSRQLNQDVYDTRRRVLGDEHPHTLSSMSNLAAALQAVGDLDESRQHSQDLTRLTGHVAAICAIDCRISAGLNRAFEQYRALVKMRPPKGSLAAALVEMAEDFQAPMAPRPESEPAALSPASAELAPPTANSRNEPNPRPSVTPAAPLDNSERETAAS
jgi:hypothetical protein